MTKRKPPIDREHATDVVDQPFPTIEPEKEFVLLPQAGISVVDTLEIQTALLLRVLGAPIVEEGSLRAVKLPASYVSKLSESARRHFGEIPAS